MTTDNRTRPDQNLAHVPTIPGDEEMPPSTDVQPETNHAEAERDRLPTRPSVAGPNNLTAGHIDNRDTMFPIPDRFAAPARAPSPAGHIHDGITATPIVHPAAGGKH
jgi:hypothetical protein